MAKLARSTVRKYLNIHEGTVPVHTKRGSILNNLSFLQTDEENFLRLIFQ